MNKSSTHRKDEEMAAEASAEKMMLALRAEFFGSGGKASEWRKGLCVHCRDAQFIRDVLIPWYDETYFQQRLPAKEKRRARWELQRCKEVLEELET